MGRTQDEMLTAMREKNYLEAAPFGSMYAKERVELLDREGLRASILYPSIGLTWECETEDLALSLAYAKAYNRWIVDFCRDYKESAHSGCAYFIGGRARSGQGVGTGGEGWMPRRVCCPVHRDHEGACPSRSRPVLGESAGA